MSLPYKYVADAAVLNFFADCTERERHELRGAWLRRMSSAHDLSIKRFGRWLVTYWPDDPVCELRNVAIEKVFA